MLAPDGPFDRLKAVLLVPVMIRLVGDVAKMTRYPEGLAWRWQNRRRLRSPLGGKPSRHQPDPASRLSSGSDMPNIIGLGPGYHDGDWRPAGRRARRDAAPGPGCATKLPSHTRCHPGRAVPSPLRTLALSVLAEIGRGRSTCGWPRPDRPDAWPSLRGRSRRPLTPLISWQDRRNRRALSGGTGP